MAPFDWRGEQSEACSSKATIVDVNFSFEQVGSTATIAKRYNEIFIIGDQNIRQYLSQLINLADRGKIQRFVLIGSEKPITNYILGSLDAHG